MAKRIHNPHVLQAQGALFEWGSITTAQGQPDKLRDLIKRFGGQRTVFLRWQTSPSAGLPSEPFKVWRRPALPLAQEKEVNAEILAFPGNVTVLQFPEPMASVALTLRATQSTNVIAFAVNGAPVFDSVTGINSKSLSLNATWKAEFHGARITGAMISGAVTVDHVTGVTIAALGLVTDWELVETVGLPVEHAGWAGLADQDHGIDQGRVGATMPAPAAAADRFLRGVNPLGWWPLFANGHAAPAWELPDPSDLVKEVGLDLLPMLRQVASLPPDDQISKIFTYAISPPQNADGEQMPGSPGKAEITPIGLLQMTVASDPMLAVVLGYGTGFVEVDIPTMNFAERQLFGDPNQSDWDWMVTGRWRHGLDGKSDDTEYACIVPRPKLGLPAPAPADLAVDFQGHVRPKVADLDWAATIRTSWEKFPYPNIARVASFASARRPTGAAGPATALLEKRRFAAGRKPIGNTYNPKDSEPTRQSATDGGLPIPNNPGLIAQRYGIATQNIFGLWSPWVDRTISVSQPPPGPVRILSADLRATDPGGVATVCPGRLIFEISVDWRVRNPAEVTLRGRLYGAAKRDAVPPAGGATSGLQRSLGGPEVASSITFAGNQPSMIGGQVECLSADGTKVVTAGPAQQGTARRYRVTVPHPNQPLGQGGNLGFDLNFGVARHIGLKLEARSVDALVSFHVGPWSETPAIAVASDPRSRPAAVVDIVRLASLPDARGQCHARIEWGDQPAAIGFAIYETTESKIRASRNLPDPSPSLTLSERLTLLKNAFRNDPRRTDFVRRNAELVQRQSLDVALPRGSQVIHLFVVIPVSAGGIEGPWPSGPESDKALIPWAAPRIAEPAPPMLEVTATRDHDAGNWLAQLGVTTRPTAGALPKRIDLYRVRVDDAARRVDSMGPPIAELTTSAGSWVVNPGEGGGKTWIKRVHGQDDPGGSWRQVWYRAVAWSEDDDLRGVRRGRSLPSPAVPVVIPPATSPDLSLPVVSWPGGGIGDVLIGFASAAPVAATPLGPHTITIEAGTPKAPAPLVRLTLPLAEVATVPPAAGSGLWRDGGYRLLLRRASVDDPVSVIVRITDPIGRSTERVLAIPSGSVLPLPQVSPVSIADIANVGRVYTFGTDAPLGSSLPQPYRLEMEVLPLAPPANPALLPKKYPFLWNGTLFALNLPLASVPTAVPPGTVHPLTIRRQTLFGSTSVVVTATVKVRTVTARIVTPDGRSVEVKTRG